MRTIMAVQCTPTNPTLPLTTIINKKFTDTEIPKCIGLQPVHSPLKVSDLRTPTCSLTSNLFTHLHPIYSPLKASGPRTPTCSLTSQSTDLRAPTCSLTSQSTDLRAPTCSLTSNLFTHLSRHQLHGYQPVHSPQTCSLTSNLFTCLQPVHSPLKVSDLRIPTCSLQPVHSPPTRSLTSQGIRSVDSSLFTHLKPAHSPPTCSLACNLFTHLSRCQI